MEQPEKEDIVRGRMSGTAGNRWKSQRGEDRDRGSRMKQQNRCGRIITEFKKISGIFKEDEGAGIRNGKYRRKELKIEKC